MSSRGEPVGKELLQDLYFHRGLSAQEIADRLELSYHKVAYWMDRYGLQRRQRSEASYLRHNPEGDKFQLDLSDRELFVAGVALYLGEGDKTNPSLVLTNSDVRVLLLWLRFLANVCHVPAARLKAHIDYHEDLAYPALLEFWSNELGIPPGNFERPTLKKARMASGSRRGRRAQHGTVHVRFHDSKLKALMMSWMDALLQEKLG